MGQLRKEILLDYLLGALDEDDTKNVERELLHNEAFRNELTTCRNNLAPIEFYAQKTESAFEPPADLARRTCRAIWEKIDADESENDAREKSVPAKRVHSRPRRPKAVASESHANATAESAPPLFSLPRVYADARTEKKPRRWKRSDLAVAMSFALVFAAILVPGISFVKDRARKIYTQKVMKKIEENSTIASQLWGERAVEMLRYANENTGSGDTYAPTDFASFLSQFEEVDLSKHAFDLVYSPQTAPDDIRDSTLLVVHRPDGDPSQKSVRRPFPNPPIFDALSRSSLSKTVLLPPSLFSSRAAALPEKTTSPVRSASFSSPMSFSRWSRAKTPLLHGTGSNPHLGTTVQDTQDRNLIILDGRVFVRSGKSVAEHREPEEP